MWDMNKRALWTVLVVFFVLGLGLVAAGVTSPEGATTDDGTPPRSIYFVIAAIFILAPLAVLGFVALSNARSSAFARAGIDAKGVILAAEQTGSYVNEQPQIAFRIRVERSDRPPYEVEHRAVTSLTSLAALQPGTILDIKVSPRNPNKIQLPSLQAHCPVHHNCHRGARECRCITRLTSASNRKRRSRTVRSGGMSAAKLTADKRIEQARPGFAVDSGAGPRCSCAVRSKQPT